MIDEGKSTQLSPIYVWAIAEEFEAYPENLRAWLCEQWDRVREAVEVNRIEVPFGTEGE